MIPTVAASANAEGRSWRRDMDWKLGKGGDYNSFIFFKDPDGNGWAIQESPLLRT